MAQTTKKNQVQESTLTVRDQEMGVESLVGITGLDKSTVDNLIQTSPKALVELVESKFREAEARKEAENAKASKASKSSRSNRMDERQKLARKLHRELFQDEEASEYFQAIAAVLDEPWKSASEIEEDVTGEQGRKLSRIVNYARMTVKVLLHEDTDLQDLRTHWEAIVD